MSALRDAAGILALCAMGAAPGQAQEVQSTEELQVAQAARTATTSAGEAGQRLTRDEASPSIAPAGRIDSRVQNRVQNRIRNRIDRYYDPRANATSPFAIASEERGQTGRRPPPR